MESHKQQMASENAAERMLLLDTFVVCAWMFVVGAVAADGLAFADDGGSRDRKTSILMFVPWPLAFATASFAWCVIAAFLGTKFVVTPAVVGIAAGQIIKALADIKPTFGGVVFGQDIVTMASAAVVAVVPTLRTACQRECADQLGTLPGRTIVLGVALPFVACAVGAGIVAAGSCAVASVHGMYSALCATEGLIAAAVAVAALVWYRGARRQRADVVFGRTRTRPFPPPTNEIIDVAVMQQPVSDGMRGRARRTLRVVADSWVAGLLVDCFKTAARWRVFVVGMCLASIMCSFLAVAISADALASASGSGVRTAGFAVEAAAGLVATSISWHIFAGERMSRFAAVVFSALSVLGCIVLAITCALHSSTDRYAAFCGYVAAAVAGAGALGALPFVVDAFLVTAAPVDPIVALPIAFVGLCAPVSGAVACAAFCRPVTAPSVVAAVGVVATLLFAKQI